MHRQTRRFCMGLAFVLVVSGFAAGCGGGDSDDDGEACAPNERKTCPCPGDAQEGFQTCKSDGSGWTSCRCGDNGDASGAGSGDAGADVVDETSACKDKDGDGRGVGPTRSNCPACEQGLPGGCMPDCDDDDPEVFPGQYERCNGEDDNCDGETEAETGVGSVACGKQECTNTQAITSCDPNRGAGETCPLEGNPEQSGTTWDCATIDGTPECVAKGSFTRGKTECKAPVGFGTCENGEWTDVPEKCTMP